METSGGSGGSGAASDRVLPADGVCFWRRRSGTKLVSGSAWHCHSSACICLYDSADLWDAEQKKSFKTGGDYEKCNI